MANRSAALVKLNRYSEAIADIDLALNLGHSKIEKLKERKGLCFTLMGRGKEAELLSKELSRGNRLKAEEIKAKWKEADGDKPGQRPKTAAFT